MREIQLRAHLVLPGSHSDGLIKRLNERESQDERNLGFLGSNFNPSFLFLLKKNLFMILCKTVGMTLLGKKTWSSEITSLSNCSSLIGLTFRPIFFK